MKDQIYLEGMVYLGATPLDEDAIQVGDGKYYGRAKLELTTYRDQLLRKFPIPKTVIGHAKYKIISQPHDFGTYYALVIKFNEDHKVAVGYAYRVEGNEPLNWDQKARAILFPPTKKEIEKAEMIYDQDAAYRLGMDYMNSNFDFSWDELPDTNSFWDFVTDGMTEKQVREVAKIAYEDRIGDSIYSGLYE